VALASEGFFARIGCAAVVTPPTKRRQRARLPRNRRTVILFRYRRRNCVDEGEYPYFDRKLFCEDFHWFAISSEWAYESIPTLKMVSSSSPLECTCACL
jgi:hypothetical protein